MCGVLARCLYRTLFGGLLLVAHEALLACIDGLAFFSHAFLRWFHDLASDCPCMPNHCVSLEHDDHICIRTMAL